MKKKLNFQNKEEEQELKNEKEYLKGEEHIPIIEISQSKKNIEKIVVNNQPTELNEILQNQEKPVKKEKIIEKKPRETYLKDKISKLNFNNLLLSGINKGIDGQLKSVRKEIISHKVLVNDLPKNLDKYLNKSFEINPNKKNEELIIKNKYKTIKDLKKEKDILNKKLMQLIENENLLENQKGFPIVEQNLNEKIKKDMTIKKNKIIQKLENINDKIKNEILNIKDINKNKQENLKIFLDNFERDKEIVEIRAK